MPIYEYECKTCKKRTELLQKISDPPLEKCPDCKGEVRKLISSAGLHFKGTGWYVTDYAKKKGEPASNEKKTETTSPKKESTSKKPATKSKD
ncbi:MAG: zinc ribbon domain-containing protein [Nitrospirae bacterium]|nr:zinc ribbon domain-containing protein [Candidatus Manganitrophaceae bacterium]